MVIALLGLFVVAFAAACGVAVYRTGRARPVVRALLTFGSLLVTPVVVFVLVSTTLTTSLPAIAVVPPVVLLGLGVYAVAEGALPAPIRRHVGTR